MPNLKPTALERLMAKVIVLPNGCWQWTGSLDDCGYGFFRMDRGVMWRAHRASYVLRNGPILKGAELDHSCHDPKLCKLGNKCPHRACVNPEHMVVSTHANNCSRERANNGMEAAHAAQRARTHCKHGHEFTPENTYKTKSGRSCRLCTLLSMRVKPQLKLECIRGHILTPDNRCGKRSNSCKMCRKEQLHANYIARKNKHQDLI